jgi:hypothetical protein
MELSIESSTFVRATALSKYLQVTGWSFPSLAFNLFAAARMFAFPGINT